jgi:hypothetical protein
MGAVMLDTLDTYLIDEFTDEAKGIAFDTCHKIYILMDNEQVDLMREYGYGDDNDPDSLLTSYQLTAREMTNKVIEWFHGSCGLRFISAVYSDERGFVDVVSQFEGNGYDEDEDEDV